MMESMSQRPVRRAENFGKASMNLDLYKMGAIEYWAWLDK